MVDKNAEMPFTTFANRKISRRDSLKLAGLTGAAFLLGRCKPPIFSTPEAPLSTVEITPAPDIRERFSELGMSDFWDFYKRVHDTEQKYQSRGNGDFFRSIYNLCKQVADGNIDAQHSELHLGRDGWGDQEKTAVDSALRHISTISVMPVDEANGNPEQLKKNQLKLFAESFAPMALALPQQLYLFKFGAGQTTRDYLATKSFAYFEPWVAWLEFFHETTHATDIYFERVKPFVQRERYLEYLTKYYEAADNVLSAAFSTESPDQHRDFWKDTQFGALLALPDISQKMNPVFARLESTFYGNSFDTEGNSLRYTKLVWEVGRHLQTIQQKQLRNEPLTYIEGQLLNNEDVSTLMTMVLQETLHVLVDSREEFYPPSDKTEHPAKVITDAQKVLNDLRIRTFATFPLEEGKDPMVQMKKCLDF